MIRSLCQEDWETVISIVNKSWQTLYTGYVAPSLVSEQGCQERAERMKRDFVQKRLSEYVWEENGQVLALLSIGIRLMWMLRVPLSFGASILTLLPEGVGSEQSCSALQRNRPENRGIRIC